MNLVLVDNLLFELRNGKPYFDLQPHMGLISLLASIRVAGFDGSLFDPKLAVSHGNLKLSDAIYGKLAKMILANRPDIVGFTSLGCNFVCTARIAAEVRKAAPSIPVLLGGPHATILDEHILGRYPQFDVVVRGEAEHSLPQLLRGWPSGQLHLVSGLTYHQQGRIVRTPDGPLVDELDTLPMPAFDAYPITNLGLKSIRIEVGRGCPFACTFCSTASFFGRSYRLKSPERIIAEMDWLNDKYGLTHFNLSHDLFTVNKKKVRDICKALQPTLYSWTCSARMDCVDASLLSTMAESGCVAIYYGVETGSPRLQRVIKKRQNLEIADSILKSTIAVGIRPTTSFIIGYPEESKSEQDETLDMAGRCILQDESVSSQIHILTPEPGTAMHVANSEKLLFDGYISDFLFPLLDEKDVEVVRNDPVTYVTHYFYPTPTVRDETIRVASSFWAFAAYGRATLRPVLSRYGDRLSALLRDFVAWHKIQEPFSLVLPQDVADFVSKLYGHSSVVTSRFLFLSAVQELQTLPEASGFFSWGPNARIRLTQTRLLRNLHQCHKGTNSPEEELVVSYVLVRDPAKDRDVRIFVVDETCIDLLEGLECSRSLGEILESYSCADERSAIQQLILTLGEAGGIETVQ